MYQLSPNLWNGSPAKSSIRLTDGAIIPMSEANTDYQAFLKYQAEGGVVLPADEVTL